MSSEPKSPWEQAFDEACQLAAEDARAGRDPAELTGRLAGHQDTYDERYVEVLCEMAAAKESN